MKNSKILITLVALIGALALVAAGTGVLWQDGSHHFDFKTLRGQAVAIQGGGLYKYDPVSVAAQGIGQDIVTLAVGIPLLIISTMLYRKNLLRGKLLLSGTLAYFLYTYTSYAFGAAYNVLFLVYVALFSLSLFAFILSLMSIEVVELPLHFSSRLPRKTISIFMFVISGFLLVAWLGRIAPSLDGQGIPVGLDSSSTLFIQVLDLGLIVPVAVLAGVLLLKQNPWGYLLSSVMLFKLFTMGLAICAMIGWQVMAGVEIALAEAIIFPVIVLIGIAFTFVLLKSISERATLGDKVVAIHR